MITCTYSYINQKYREVAILRMLVSSDEPITEDDVKVMDCYEEIYSDVNTCKDIPRFVVEFNQIDDTIIDVIFTIYKPIPNVIPAPKLVELERLLKNYGSRQES